MFVFISLPLWYFGSENIDSICFSPKRSRDDTLKMYKNYFNSQLPSRKKKIKNNLYDIILMQWPFKVYGRLSSEWTIFKKQGRESYQYVINHLIWDDFDYFKCIFISCLETWTTNENFWKCVKTEKKKCCKIIRLIGEAEKWSKETYYVWLRWHNGIQMESRLTTRTKIRINIRK